MKIKNKFPMLLDLQLFAEGGAVGDGGTAAAGETGESATDAVSQESGVEAPDAEVKNEETAEERNKRYEEFLKEFKDLDDTRVQSIVKQRLKGSRENAEKLESLAPVLEMLGKKYGVEASDLTALSKAIEEDDSFYEEEAEKMGLSVAQYKEYRKVMRENETLRREKEARDRKEKADKQVSAWIKESEGIKQVYPSFDLESELKNDQFVSLLRSNIDLRTAYEVIHKDDIIAGAMEYTAKQVEEKLAKKAIADAARPVENGNSSQSAAVMKSGLSQLTKAERAELNRRALRGEKITL